MRTDAFAQALEVDVALGLVQAEALHPVHEGHRPAGGDHRLGRDAVPQVGGAADHVLLDQRDLAAEAGGVGRGLVAGRATTDDDEAQGHGGRLSAPPRSAPGRVRRRVASAAGPGGRATAAGASARPSRPSR